MDREQFIKTMTEAKMFDLTQGLSIFTPPWPGEKALEVHFFKRLTGVEQCQTASATPCEITVASALVTLKPRSGLIVDFSGTHTKQEYEISGGAELKCDQSALTLSVQQELGRKSYLSFEYTKILGDSDPDLGDAQADIGSLLLAVDF